MSHNTSTKVTQYFNSKVLSAAFFVLCCSFKRKRFRDIPKRPYQGRDVELSHKYSSGGARHFSQRYRRAIQEKTPFHFHRVSQHRSRGDFQEIYSFKRCMRASVLSIRRKYFCYNFYSIKQRTNWFYTTINEKIHVYAFMHNAKISWVFILKA